MGLSAVGQNFLAAFVMVVLFGVTIFVHELGHFLVALKSGMVIDAFSLGFGPPVWQRTFRGITFKIGCIPFGGYVALPQLDPAAMATVQGKGRGPKDDTGTPADRRVLPPLSPWTKVLVSLAGAGGNVLLAVGLAWVIFLSPDAVIDERGTLVGYVATNSAAYAAGLRIGDEIVSVNGEAVRNWNEYAIECHLAAGAAETNVILLTVSSGGRRREIAVPVRREGDRLEVPKGVQAAPACVVTAMEPDSPAARAAMRVGDVVCEVNGVRVAGILHFVSLLQAHRDQEVAVTVERAGARKMLTVTPRYNAEHGKTMIGVVVESGEVLITPWMQYKKPGAQIRNDARGIVRILRALVSRREGEARQAAGALGGPVMILATLWWAVRSSLLNALGFLRFLNVNLAILNLLPLPVLDGGHVIFSIWEGVTRRPVPPRVVHVLFNVFAALLIALAILLTFRDVTRLPRLFAGRGEERPAAEQTAPADGEQEKVK